MGEVSGNGFWNSVSAWMSSKWNNISESVTKTNFRAACLLHKTVWFIKPYGTSWVFKALIEAWQKFLKKKTDHSTSLLPDIAIKNELKNTHTWIALLTSSRQLVGSSWCRRTVFQLVNCRKGNNRITGVKHGYKSCRLRPDFREAQTALTLSS